MYSACRVAAGCRCMHAYGILGDPALQTAFLVPRKRCRTDCFPSQSIAHIHCIFAQALTEVVFVYGHCTAFELHHVGTARPARAQHAPERLLLCRGVPCKLCVALIATRSAAYHCEHCQHAGSHIWFC